jgi:hypothetical protein
MKKILLVLIVFFPMVALAEDAPPYPWILTGFGGGATLCDEAGCFGAGGPAFGGSFGRAMSSRWSFELEGTIVFTSETGATRVDTVSGIIYQPVLERTRVWGGGHFLGRIADIGSSSDVFISLGIVGAYEQQKEIVPEGVFPIPIKDVGIKGGIAGGAGANIWFSENWGIRPEARYYLVAGSLSGIRYTGGLMYKF